MSLERSAIAGFAIHQTFHPRFGWIKKGYDAADNDPNVFNRAEAPVILGVGKNMVEAIKAWSTATHVISRVPKPDRPRMSVAVHTPLGRALLDNKTGVDPYIEDPTTLWVLHWQAISEITLLPVWWATFNDFTALEFTENDLLRFCIEEIASTGWPQPKESSIQKDVDCLLRMYTRRDTRARQTLDELLDSPFRELGIIRPAPAGRDTYRFVRGAKPGLSAAAITYACLDYLAITDPDSRTASLTRLSSDPGSPGRLMKLTEDVIQSALEDTARGVAGIRMAAPAGVTQLVLDMPPIQLAKAVLWSHHRERRSGVPVPVCHVAGPLARAADPASRLGLTTPRRVSRKARHGSAA